MLVRVVIWCMGQHELHDAWKCRACLRMGVRPAHGPHKLRLTWLSLPQMYISYCAPSDCKRLLHVPVAGGRSFRRAACTGRLPVSRRACQHAPRNTCLSGHTSGLTASGPSPQCGQGWVCGCSGAAAHGAGTAGGAGEGPCSAWGLCMHVRASTHIHHGILSAMCRDVGDDVQRRWILNVVCCH